MSPFHLQAGRDLFMWLQQLSAQAVLPLGMGDNNVDKSKHGGDKILTDFLPLSLPPCFSRWPVR